MEYKLLKHINNEEGGEIEIGSIFTMEGEYYHFDDGKTCPIDFLIREGYIAKIDKVDFKVGDYAVYDKGKNIKGISEYIDVEYIKIHTISKAIGGVLYYNGHYGNFIRKPTKEELEKYFK